MSIEIAIPVHPAVPKFLAYSYNTTPFLVCNGLTQRISPFGFLLYNSLVRITQNDREAPVFFNHAQQRVAERRIRTKSGFIDMSAYTSSLTLSISEYTYQHRGWHILPGSVHDFNRMVLYFIYQEFCQFMDIHVAKGEKIYTSIIAFRKKYDLLEEDLAVKTLEKKYERYRRDLKALKSGIKN